MQNRNHKQFDWNDGRLFLAVARAGQILAAARQLGMNQSTLSRRMVALEHAFDTKLLIRRTQGIELTDAGASLVETLERVETSFHQSQAALQGANAAVTGVVRIGAPDGFGVAFLAPRLSILLDQHPDLKVQLVPTSQSFSLSRREADIAVMVGRPEKGRLVTRKLTDYTLGLYASKTYLDGHGEPRSPADLADHRLVGYVEDLVTASTLNYTSQFWRQWRSRLEVSGAMGQIEAVRAGAGIGVLHDYLVRADQDLIRLMPAQQVVRSYWIATHENLRDMARVRAASDFLAMIVKEAKDDFLLEA